VGAAQAGADKRRLKEYEEYPGTFLWVAKPCTVDAMTSLPVIAIDGNAASGKGALARSLAKKLGFAHMDTGVLYRLVALRMLENGCAASDEKSAVEFARMVRLVCRPYGQLGIELLLYIKPIWKSRLAPYIVQFV
jgi:hypothetical protein